MSMVDTPRRAEALRATAVPDMWCKRYRRHLGRCDRSTRSSRDRPEDPGEHRCRSCGGLKA